MTASKLSCSAENCPYDGRPEDRRGWHITKGLDLGHLLVTLSMLAGFMLWAMAQERRLTTVENGLLYERNTNVQQDQAKARSDDQMADRLQRIEEKIDRLMVRK